MTDDLNKEWAELEGWKQDSVGLWVTPKGIVYGLDGPPDWTEPNLFFAEVVPRMEKLGLYPNIYKSKCSDTWTFGWYRESLGDRVRAYGKTIGEAGLKAAIQARKELNG